MSNVSSERFDQLRFCTLTFVLKITEKIILPSGIQKGYLLRNSLGNALHKTSGDFILEKFWNNKLTGDQHNVLGISTDPPRGYIIEPPDTNRMVFNPNEIIELNVILVGYVAEYINAFIDAFEFMGTRSGLGIAELNGCGKFSIDAVIINGKKKRKNITTTGSLSIDKLEDKEFSSKVKLNFISPAIIWQSDKTSLLKMKSNNDVSYYFLSLFKRLNALQAVYCTGKYIEVDSDAVFSNAKDIKVNSGALKQTDDKFEGEKLNGFLGELLLRGDLSFFKSALLLGEYLHIGSKTNYSFGRYEIVQ